MRCPERLIAAALLAAALNAHAAPDAVRAQIAQRLQAQIPSLATSDYALGAAAFDPERRAAVDENRGAAAGVIERGAARWKRKFRDGRSLASCFPNGGRRIASAYPLYDPRIKDVVTLELAVNQCLKTHKERVIDGADSEAMAEITAYVRSLSAGQRIAVRVPAAAERAFEEGRRLYFTRMGQLNFACASCHLQGAGKRYEDTPLPPVIGQATQWPFIRDGKPFTLQAQIRDCLERMGAAPFPAGSDELNHVEYFVAYLSNGLALRPNAWRPPRR